MFVTVKSLTILIDKRIGYVKDARSNNLGDDKYFEEMEDLIRKGLQELKRISSNEKLIKQYEAKVNELF